VRADGPYGHLGLNYRRYGVLFLAGGGIGMTPIISLLKDIYGAEQHRNTKPHCMECVHVVWVMPHVEEATLFLDTLNAHLAESRTNPSLPSLEVHVHCTRAKKGEVFRTQIRPGRPDFGGLLDEAALRTPLAPTLVFACGPGKMVNQLWDESNTRNSQHSRYDFHHETFEF
jgi:predicted ferric reductase